MSSFVSLPPQSLRGYSVMRHCCATVFIWPIVSAERMKLLNSYGLLAQPPSPRMLIEDDGSLDPGTKDCWQEYWTFGVNVMGISAAVVRHLLPAQATRPSSELSSHGFVALLMQPACGIVRPGKYLSRDVTHDA